MRKTRVVLISVAAAAITLTGCLNVSGGEYYVTLPPAPTVNSGAPTGDDSVAGSETTTAAAAQPSGDETSGGTTLIAVELDSDGNVVTDENGAPVTTIITERSPDGGSDISGISGIGTTSPTAGSDGSGNGSTEGSGNTVSGSENGTPAVGSKMQTISSTPFYSSDDTSSKVMSLLPSGMEVTVTGSADNGWYQVSAGGMSGYVKSTALTKPKTTTTTTTAATTTTTKATTTKPKTTTPKPKTTTPKPKTTTPKPVTTAAPKPNDNWLSKYDSDVQQKINEVLKYTNEVRKKHGLGPLILDEKLTEIAMIRAEQNSREAEPTHLDSKTMKKMYNQYLGEYSWESRGENLAYGQSTPDRVVASLEASSNHLTNILGGADKLHDDGTPVGKFTHIGIGVCYVSNTKYGWYWVQEFVTYW